MKRSLLLLALPLQVFASDYTSQLAKEGALKITQKECKGVEDKLGQLLYATVYIDDEKSKAASNEAYFNIIKDLNLGAILPHYSYSGNAKSNGRSIYEWNQKMKTLSSTPPIIGVDYVIDACGLGYGKGILEDASLSECREDIYKFQAACHAYFGVSQAIGPTVERSSYKGNHPYMLNSPQVVKDAKELVNEFDKVGVSTTMKHFPYTPEDYNLHKQSKDTKLSKQQVTEKLLPFKEMSKKVDFAMSTHLYNSSIDPEDMATFSKKWISLLRNEVKFDGILVTDALFMISEYQDTMKSMSRKWNHALWKKKLGDQSIFAVRALLAGHNMVFLDGTAQDTRTIFKNLLYVACEDNQISKDLRKHIADSHKKIIAYKTKHAADLKKVVPYNPEFIQALFKNEERALGCEDIKEAMAFLKPGDCDSKVGANPTVDKLIENVQQVIEN